MGVQDYERAQALIQAGVDVLVVDSAHGHSKNVIDTVGRGERFGEARLGDVLAQASGAADAIRRVDEALKQFAEGPQGDDTAVLALERVAAVTAEDVPSSLLIEGAGPAS